LNIKVLKYEFTKLKIKNW